MAEYSSADLLGGSVPSVILMALDDIGNLRPISCDSIGNICANGPSHGLPFGFFLTSAGDGTGNFNLNGNYSSGVTEFTYIATSKYDVKDVLMTISDNASFNQTDYGAISGGLTNGISFFLHPAGAPSPLPLLGGHIFKRNIDWFSITPHVSLTSFSGLAQTLIVEFQLVNDYGKPLNMAVGDKFIVRLNDDFTGLVNHTFALRGIKY